MDRTVQIITSHQTADFDALAAAAAARRLYPGAQVVLGGGVSPDVRAFVSLHKDVLDPKHRSEVEPGAVARLIVVDTRRASRLRHVQALLAQVERGHTDLHVYDHHEASPDDIVGSFEVVEAVGAATTLLVERIRERDLQLTSFEATLFALGIHVDTGSFSYARSHARDLSACAWLYEQGCELEVLNRYLRPAFDAAQREILQRLLAGLCTERFGGLPVALAEVSLSSGAPELAPVVSEALALSSSAALFAIFELGRQRLQVIARGRSPLIDCGQILKRLGGGGHPGAASASVRSRSADEVMRVIEEALRSDPPAPQRVADLMSQPVRTLAADLSLGLARSELERWGTTGAPILKQRRLVGVISRRDIDKALKAGRGELPVSSCMAQAIKTATPDEPLSVALDRMVQSDVGRLPVLDGDRLVGIVTRSDILRALYGKDGL